MTKSASQSPSLVRLPTTSGRSEIEIALIQEKSTDLFRTPAKPDFLLNIVLSFLSQFLRLGFVPMALKGPAIRLFVAIASTYLVTEKLAGQVTVASTHPNRNGSQRFFLLSHYLNVISFF